jgi:hypothetical protein
VGLKAVLGICRRKNLLPPPITKPRFFGHPACNLVTVPNGLKVVEQRKIPDPDSDGIATVASYVVEFSWLISDKRRYICKAIRLPLKINVQNSSDKLNVLQFILNILNTGFRFILGEVPGSILRPVPDRCFLVPSYKFGRMS